MNNYPTLELGDVGSDVRVLQQLLKIVGLFPGSITGSFDTTTENAVLSFQEEYGLDPDGIVDSEVWNYLLEATAGISAQDTGLPILEIGDSGEDVSLLQEQLATTLYYNDDITGEFDSLTEDAVKVFQLNNQILANGVVNNQTWSSLENAYSSVDCDITEVPPVNDNVQSYTVQKGDTLYGIAQKFNTTVDKIKELNRLTSNTIIPGEVILIPLAGASSSNTYTVKKGDTLYSIAQAFNLSVDDLKKANNLTSNVLSIGQVLTIPSVNDNYLTYTVKKGDTLFSIARNYNVSVNDLMSINNLSSSILSIGQTLVIPTTSSDNYKSYTVKKGDTLFGIASRFGTTVDNIKRINNLTSNTLNIGQVLLIP